MTSDESKVREAAIRFYDAIEALVSGKGIAAMKEAWHHTDRVTGGHPSGEWSQGWDEVLATWTLFGGFGHPERGGSKVRDVKAYVYGDVAYTTCIFTFAPAYGGDTIACTNILHRVDGVWKIVHHHADKSAKMDVALEKIAQGG